MVKLTWWTAKPARDWYKAAGLLLSLNKNVVIYFFLCDLDGHIEDKKVQKSLEELGLHCQDFHVLGVFEADKLREK